MLDLLIVKHPDGVVRQMLLALFYFPRLRGTANLYLIDIKESLASRKKGLLARLYNCLHICHQSLSGTKEAGSIGVVP